jgi:acetoin utilization protein AcuB
MIHACIFTFIFVCVISFIFHAKSNFEGKIQGIQIYFHNIIWKGGFMFVGKFMSKPVITIRQDMTLPDALDLVKEKNIRRLPVTNDKGKLVGIITESDLLHASPSDATSLSVWELNYLLSKTTIADIMTREVITTTENTPIEEAARIMADNKIGGLPVVDNDMVTGIITETDLFKLFLELFGARDRGIRMSLIVRNEPGALAKVTKVISDVGGNIIALGTLVKESSPLGELTVKVSGVDESQLREVVSSVVETIEDISIN